MSSLRLRNDTYHVCFRYRGKQYDRSLKTNDGATFLKASAKPPAARNAV
jgi:hypothetical protein